VNASAAVWKQDGTHGKSAFGLGGQLEHDDATLRGTTQRPGRTYRLSMTIDPEKVVTASTALPLP
jgi:hypothetical protein